MIWTRDLEGGKTLCVHLWCVCYVGLCVGQYQSRCPSFPPPNTQHPTHKHTDDWTMAVSRAAYDHRHHHTHVPELLLVSSAKAEAVWVDGMTGRCIRVFVSSYWVGKHHSCMYALAHTIHSHTLSHTHNTHKQGGRSASLWT